MVLCAEGTEVTSAPEWGSHGNMMDGRAQSFCLLENPGRVHGDFRATLKFFNYQIMVGVNTNISRNIQTLANNLLR